MTIPKLLALPVIMIVSIPAQADSNTITLLQEGNNQAATISQIDRGHSLTQFQTGDENTGSVLQQGAEQTAVLEQEGESNVASLDQNGGVIPSVLYKMVISIRLMPCSRDIQTSS